MKLGTRRKCGNRSLLLSTLLFLIDFTNSQLSSVFHELPAALSHRALLEESRFVDTEDRKLADDEDLDDLDLDDPLATEILQDEVKEPMWIRSGKFQGDIDGVDPHLLKKLNTAPVQMNALRNKQLIWTNGIVPYVLDEAFTQSEVKLLEKAFRTYRKRTCIRFRPHNGEKDYLHIVKGLGCYSQVGKTGGKQEISLGRGCLYHEIVLHELMHSLGAWHEHSRADRDDFVKIRWENILNGMESQFDIISPALQDTQGVRYDYRSIMHYDSAAFSRNGKNTIETVEDGFTSVIGAAKDLSELDIVKLNKLYQCAPKTSSAKKSVFSRSRSKAKVTLPPPLPMVGRIGTSVAKDSAATKSPTALTTTAFASKLKGTPDCHDHFLDCPGFKDYCRKVSFFFVMKAYCPQTCGHCQKVAA
uniref:Metalloendopeptidase n=1 Tax=Bursaphelenchus xylophilus TaxID=6326 RepID=A0A1I7SBN2_BURXY